MRRPPPDVHPRKVHYDRLKQGYEDGVPMYVYGLHESTLRRIRVTHPTYPKYRVGAKFDNDYRTRLQLGWRETMYEGGLPMGVHVYCYEWFDTVTRKDEKYYEAR